MDGMYGWQYGISNPPFPLMFLNRLSAYTHFCKIILFTLTLHKLQHPRLIVRSAACMLLHLIRARAQVRKARIKPGEETDLKAAVRAMDAQRAAAEQCNTARQVIAGG
jgi:hypothetical protein